MRVFTLGSFLFFLVFGGQAFSKSKTKLECLMEANQKADSFFGFSEILGHSYMNKVESVMKDPAAVYENAYRQQIQAQMHAQLPDNFRPIQISEEPGEKGVINTVFQRFPETLSIDWKDRTQTEPYVKASCENVAAGIAGKSDELIKWCVQSFYAKINLAEKFVAKNKTLIDSAAEEIKKNPKSGLRLGDFIKEEQIKRNKAQDMTMMWELYMGQGDMPYVHDQTISGNMPRFALDQSGRPRGVVLSIGKESGGEPEKYFVPNLSSNPKSPKYVNPYFFSQGPEGSDGVSASEWNAYWSRILGTKLFFNGEEL